MEDRKSTRLNSSHEWISYAVFCLKKKIEEVEGCSLHSSHSPLLTFFFNETPTTGIYTLSLHDALPICFAEPAARMSFGYVMNRMGEGLGINARGQSLVDAVYLSLGYTSNASGAWKIGRAHV